MRLRLRQHLCVRALLCRLAFLQRSQLRLLLRLHLLQLAQQLPLPLLDLLLRLLLRHQHRLPYLLQLQLRRLLRRPQLPLPRLRGARGLDRVLLLLLLPQQRHLLHLLRLLLRGSLPHHRLSDLRRLFYRVGTHLVFLLLAILLCIRKDNWHQLPQHAGVHLAQHRGQLRHPPLQPQRLLLALLDELLAQASSRIPLKLRPQLRRHLQHVPRPPQPRLQLEHRHLESDAVHLQLILDGLERRAQRALHPD
mmetsp:Transcript_66656/g.182829  ORF Transcript_66656/g.182829 Transcript_66656/m.182829 type:complete len:250 (-) Transcript_66656:1133-1882(-)